MAENIKPGASIGAAEPEFFVVFPSSATFRKMTSGEVLKLQEKTELLDTEAEAKARVNAIAKERVLVEHRRSLMKLKVAKERQAFAERFPAIASACRKIEAEARAAGEQLVASRGQATR